MNSYTSQYMLNKEVNEFKRIEKILKPYAKVDDQNQMPVGYAMLKVEQEKLRGNIERSAHAAMFHNPLETDPFFQKAEEQLLRDNSIYVTNNNMFNPRNNPYMPIPSNSSLNFAGEPMYGGSSSGNHVSPAEQQRACEALTPNGCGPSGSKGKIVRDKPGGFNFTPACNQHDRNYSTLDFSFSNAKSMIYNDMMNIVDPKLHREVEDI